MLKTSLAVLALLMVTIPFAATNEQNALDEKGLIGGDLVTLRHAEAATDESFAVIVAIEGQDYTLEFQSDSVRNAGFAVKVQLADGTYENFEPANSRVIKGTVRGLPGSRVVGSELDSGLFAKIVMPDGQLFYIEPLSEELAQKVAQSHVVYRNSDVPDFGLKCGIIDPANGQRNVVAAPRLNRRDSESNTQSVVLPRSSLQVAELAVDADVEFFELQGSDVQSAIDRVEMAIAIVNDQYETQVGITHELTTIIIRSAEPDPYSSFDAFVLLQEHIDHFVDEQQDVVRDVAHLFTGKDLGGIGGVAALGAICNLETGYALSRFDIDIPDLTPSQIVAHELGHNWNSGHCSCPGNTMNDGTPISHTFSAGTIDVITSFRDSLSCLDDAVLLGDVNLDGDVNLLDVAPFVALLADGAFQEEADINNDNQVNLLDVSLFVDLLVGG